MRKFWGLYKNDKYIVGCNGATVYVYDTDWKELAKFNDFPYAYNGAFKPGSNVIAVKSTEGYLGFYDLDTLRILLLRELALRTKVLLFQKTEDFFITLKSLFILHGHNLEYTKLQLIAKYKRYLNTTSKLF